MNTTATATATTTATAVMNVAGVSLPASLPRGEAAALIRSLVGNESAVIALASNKAKAEAALAVSLGIALQSAVFGDQSALKRIESAARAHASQHGLLTKADKAGNRAIKGTLGKLVAAFKDAATFGSAYRDLQSPEFDLAGMLSSPLCPALPAPKAEAPTTEAPTTEAPTTEAPTTEAPTTEAPTTEAPTTEAATEAATEIKRSAREQVQRDRAAKALRTLRATIRAMNAAAEAPAKPVRKTRRQAANA